LKADVPLVSQGFDSLDTSTLMLELEIKYKKAIPPEKAARLRTLKDIVNFLNGSVAPSTSANHGAEPT
jgi:acyl carrier protein